MKLSLICFFFVLCSLKSDTWEGMKWNYTSYDFGEIKEGTQAKARFVCYNNSDSVFIIEKVLTSCACTTPHYTVKPVYKGDSAIVIISFNTSGKRGHFNKYTGVYTNRGLIDLKISAFIKE